MTPSSVMKLTTDIFRISASLSRFVALVHTTGGRAKTHRSF
jgi:hypothetical protein